MFGVGEKFHSVQLSFPPTVKLAGRVVDPAGAPVSVHLGLDLSFSFGGYRIVRSGEDGTIDFGSIGTDAWRIASADTRWEVVDGGEVSTEAPVVDHTVVVARVPTSRIRGTITLDGDAPGRPLMVALGRDDRRQLGHRAATAWTDGEGRFEIHARPGKYHLHVKHTADRSVGWRRFASELDTHRGGRPWTVTFAENGVEEYHWNLRSEPMWHPDPGR